MAARELRLPSRTWASLLLVGCLALAVPTGAEAEIRVGNLSVFFNDQDMTVQVILLGAIPASLHESLHSGVPAHVRLAVELWQYSRFWIEPRLQARTVERQLTYNVLTKEYKVTSVTGEQREPYVSKSLRDAQRVISGVRVPRVAPAGSLSQDELYYVRVRADVALNGVNSWLARVTGDAEQTPWVQSSLLTVNRIQ